MSEGPRAEGGGGDTTTGPKPSIAEVAAWLRRAAEQREGSDDLGPGHRPSEAADPADSTAPEGELTGPAAAVGTLTSEPEAPDVDPEGAASGDAEGDEGDEGDEGRNGLPTEAEAEVLHPLDPLGSALELGGTDDLVEEAAPSEDQAGEPGQDPEGSPADLQADQPTDEVPVVESSSVAAPEAPADERGPEEAVADETSADETSADEMLVDEARSGAGMAGEAPADEVPADRRDEAVTGRVTEDDEPAVEAEPFDDVAVDGASTAVAPAEEVETAGPGGDEGPEDVAGLDVDEADEPGELGEPGDPATDMPHVEALLVEPAEGELDPGDPDVEATGGPAGAELTDDTPDRAAEVAEDGDLTTGAGDPSASADLAAGGPGALDEIEVELSADRTLRPFGTRRSAEPSELSSTASELEDPASPQPAVAAIEADLDDEAGEQPAPGDAGDAEEALADADLLVRADPDTSSEADPAEEAEGLTVDTDGTHDADEDDEDDEGEEAVAGPQGSSSLASLFDLDLAELAARARRAGERESSSAESPFDARADDDVHSEDDEPGALRVEAPEARKAPGTSSEEDDLERAERDREPVAAEPRGGPLVWDDDELEAQDDREPAEATAPVEAAKPGPRLAPAMAAVAAALKRQQAKRKPYPRGQLKERIGILRRIRAMLGVVVLTVVLGVAAGAAIGAFLVFLAFAVRGAITSG